MTGFLFLRQSTAALVPVGPMVDATDGFTLETAISLASSEANLFKAGAVAAIDIGGNTWSSHLNGGMYNITLTTSNTDTLGPLTFEVHDSAARPFRVNAMVLPANIYDSLILGTDELLVDVTKINGNNASGFLSGTDHIKSDVLKVNANTSAASNLGNAAQTMAVGTVQTGSTLTIVKTNLTEATNDHYNGLTLKFITGNLAGAGTTISDYNGSTKDITVTQLVEAPANGDTFVII